MHIIQCNGTPAWLVENKGISVLIKGYMGQEINESVSSE